MHYNHPNIENPRKIQVYLEIIRMPQWELLYPFGLWTTIQPCLFGMRVSKKKLELSDTLNLGNMCPETQDCMLGKDSSNVYRDDRKQDGSGAERFCKIKLEPEKKNLVPTNVSELNSYRQDCTYTVETDISEYLSN